MVNNLFPASDLPASIAICRARQDWLEQRHRGVPQKETGLKQNERLGLAYALAAFSVLTMGDTVIKTMTGEWPPTAIAALRFVFGALGMGGLVWLREGRAALVHVPSPWIQLLRGAGLGLGALTFFSALFVMPLANAAALTFTSPMITAVLAALVLGEPMRRVNWLASLAAFGGVLIILRPNLAELGWAALLPLGTAFCMSWVMIGNRLVAGKASPMAMQYLVALVASPILIAGAMLGHFSGIAGLAIGWPDWSVIGRCAFVAFSASSAHFLLYLATTRAGPATIAPMTYVQLVVAGLLGWVVFGDVPDAMALLGSLIIVGAGLVLWHSQAPVAGEGEVVP